MARKSRKSLARVFLLAVRLCCLCLLHRPTLALSWTRVDDDSPHQSALHSRLVESQWQFTLPEWVLQQCFLFQGSTGRVKQVLMRLLSGETVRIGALGGSITAGAVAGPGKEYFLLVTQWLAAAFPKATVIGRNGAIGATPSMYMERFLDSRLDPDVDLVFVEYAVNNRIDLSTMHYEDVKSFERLLRALLRGVDHAAPKPAAVMIVDMWWAAKVNGSDIHLYPYTYYLGDHHNVLAQYYAVPSVSVRNGLYHAFRTGKGMFKNITDVYPVNQANETMHPNVLGHRLIADMIIYAFYVTLQQLELNGITQGDSDIIARPQPPPLVAEPDQEVILRSWHNEALQEIFFKASGWSWVVERGKKGGYLTQDPGSKLTLKIDTRIPKHLVRYDPRLEGAPVVVHLGMLRSYEHMGQVRVYCVDGCTCTERVFDTNHPEQHSSQNYPYQLQVSESSACKVRLECLEKSTSIDNEHKLALRGLSVVAIIQVPASRGMPYIPAG